LLDPIQVLVRTALALVVIHRNEILSADEDTIWTVLQQLPQFSLSEFFSLNPGSPADKQGGPPYPSRSPWWKYNCLIEFAWTLGLEEAMLSGLLSDD